MRVVHIITKLELGGAQENTLHTLGHLDHGEFSGMLVTHPEGILVEDALRDGRYEKVFVPSLVREVRPWSDLKALLDLYRLLSREVRQAGPLPLIVHTHSSKAGVLGRTAARLAGVPVIIHSIHGYGFHAYQPRLVRWLFLSLEKMVARWTSHFIAVSRVDVDAGLAHGLFSDSGISLIRSGIAVSRFRGDGLDVAAKRASLGLHPGGKVVGMVSCLKPQKNPVDFVRLAAVVAAEVPESQFILAGDGVIRPRVEKAVRESRLGDRFHLLGWRRDVDEIIPSLDVMVLTSLWEGLPRVMPQAMAAGKPIVAYRAGGVSEAVVDGVNGFLVDPGDVSSAARHVIHLLRDPAAGEALGRRGAAMVGEFDDALMVRQQQDLYRRLWSQCRGDA